MSEDERKGAEKLEADELFASDERDFRALLRTRDREGLISALESPDLYRLACDDPRYSQIAMEGIAVLAWDEPAQASELLVRFDANRSRQDPTSSARMAARSLMAALEWRQLESEADSPLARAEILRDFLRFYPALAEEGEHATKLRDDLQARPALYADLFQYLESRAQVLPRWICNLVAQGPGVRVEFDEAGYVSARELSDAQRSAIQIAIAELRESLKSPMTQYLLWVVVVGLVIALPTALGGLLALLLLGASLALGEGKTYQSIVRPRLILLAIEHGVGARQVVRSIYGSTGKAGKVGNFDIKIENDRALDLLAALSSALWPAASTTDAAGENS